MATVVKDIHPRTPVAYLARSFSSEELETEVDAMLASKLTGMSVRYINAALGRKNAYPLTLKDMLNLLDLDAFSETFVPRSQIPSYVLRKNSVNPPVIRMNSRHLLIQGNAKSLISALPKESIPCVVTSSPYWALRLYPIQVDVEWADGEVCPYGHEQTPEGFIRHTVELLFLLQPKLTRTSSVWWNIGDTYNTRTPIRRNAAETLRAMRGDDTKGWRDHDCRRYSAGHSYIHDGEQCLIPSRIAERASRIGYWVKSMISWKKLGGTTPEPVESRVGREVEYVIHLAVSRSPYFDKDTYKDHEAELGGRNSLVEQDKLTDIWAISTATGFYGHGAQFPIALPGRCIALSTRKNDIVLDPFVGTGTTSVAAAKLKRRSIGMDVSQEYLSIAVSRLAAITNPNSIQILNDGSTREAPNFSSSIDKRPPLSLTSII